MEQSLLYSSDVERILSKRHAQGGDYWATPDHNYLKGSPTSTISSALLLLELGLSPTDPILTTVASLLFGAQRPDGRFKLAPKGAIYPCQTIYATNALCHLGYAKDERMAKTLDYLLATQEADGGWRCNKYFFGHGLETEYSNPFPTLIALDAFRHTSYANHDNYLDQAVLFLLNHWDIRLPIGPCHYGIGTLFMQIEYPFMTYNLFYYVYILSFYCIAHQDSRFLEALEVLESKLEDGQIVVKRTNRELAYYESFAKGKPSALGTKRYQELKQNLNY